MEPIKEKEQGLVMAKQRTRSSQMRNSREGILLETSSFSQERDSGISNPTSGCNDDRRSHDHTLIPSSTGVRSPLGYGSLASYHSHNELPKDIEELKNLRETLKKQKEDLLKGKERTELTLEVIRLQDEISSLRSHFSSQEGIFPRPPQEWISTLGSTADATSFDIEMPFMNYEAHFERCLGYPESCITREDEFTDCQSLPDPLSDEDAKPEPEQAPPLPEKSITSSTQKIATLPRRIATPPPKAPSPPPREVTPHPSPLCTVNVETTENGAKTSNEAEPEEISTEVVVEQETAKVKMSTKGCCSITFNAIALLALAIAIIIHILAWYPTETLDFLHDKDRANFWITPHLGYLTTDWIFWMWVAVYALQVIWMLYAFTVPWRVTTPSDLLYKVLNPGLYIIVILSHGCTMAWLYLWEQLGYVQYSVIGIALASCFSFIALGRVAQNTYCNITNIRLQVNFDLSMLRLLVMNGLGAHAIWTFLLTRYHVCIIIHEYTDLEYKNNLYVYLGIAFAFLLVWFLVDILGVKRPFSFVVTPYIIPILVLIPLIQLTYYAKELPFILSVLQAGLYGLVLLIKLAVTINRERSHHDDPPSIRDVEQNDEKGKELEAFHFGSESDLTLPRKGNTNDAYQEKC